MNNLLDHCVPQPLKNLLTGHQVSHAFEMGWQQLRNGDLLLRAEESFETLLTSDKNITHQQPWTGRRLSVLVLWTNNWPDLRFQFSRILAELETLTPGSWREMD
jgi:hypothetical protein